VAVDLYSKTFLRVVLWFQLLLLIAPAWLVVLTLRFAGVGMGWAFLALLVFAASSPETAANVLFDTLLTGFLLALGLCALTAWLTSRMGLPALLLAAISFSLAALSHAVFQLIAVFLTAILYIPLRRSMGPAKASQMAASLLLCWLVFVGGMSAYNLKQHQFFGLSAVMGSGIGTKTWPFIERIAPFYPDVDPVFVGMRDKLLREYYEHTGVYWGDPACQWLMKERGLSYVAANKYLLKFNISAIRHGNEVYPPEVLKSLVLFLTPAFPYQVPGAARFVYYLAKALIFFIFIAACTYRITGWVISGGRKLLDGSEPRTELVLVAAIGMFLYAAFIVCAADMGKPGQRAPILFVIPIVLALSLRKRDTSITVRERPEPA
jgi:hypothetical protein